MIIRRTLQRLLIVLGCVVGLIAFANPALAVYPPGGGPIITTDRQVYPAGVPVNITVRACTAGATVSVTVQQGTGQTPLILTGIADAGGNATFTLDSPPNGVSTVTASCGGSAGSASFTVNPQGPVTGTETRSSLAIAAVLVAVGSGLLFVARSRRRKPERETVSLGIIEPALE